MSKIILHIDFNSFFASVEQQANPFLRGKAIAIAGKSKQTMDGQIIRQKLDQIELSRTVITTASREAKKIGVKTAMASTEAKKLCPELITIPGDPYKYSEITKRFLAILGRYADAVEQFSTDEAFADLTLAAGDYFGATMIAQMIRADVKRECGARCTASIGIAPNKLVAKLAGESVKPSGLTVVRPEEVTRFVAAQQLTDICGIGSRTEKRIYKLGATTIVGLRKIPLPTLLNEFKSYGYFLYLAARGIGDDSVSDEIDPPKSIGHSYTFPHDLDDENEIKKNLLALCDKVAWRMRRDGFLATRISVYARYASFARRPSLRSRQAGPPAVRLANYADRRRDGCGTERRYQEPMEDGLDLYKSAWRLLDSIRDQHRSIRLLGVSASGLMQTGMPARLFPKDRKMHRVLRALDQIQTKYGAGSWQRAATLGTIFRCRSSGWHYDHEA